MKPEDHELDEMLKRLRVPERSPGYWEYLPKRITARLQEQSGAAPVPGRFPFLAWGIGFGTACLAVGLAVGIWWGKQNAGEVDTAHLAESRKLFQEIAAMFPNRVQSIVVDANGVRLDLSDKENVPDSTPLLVSLCKAGKCQRIITFSGQTVKINGDTCEVLADGKGNILLVGQRFIWSSAEPTSAGAYRIQAESLGAS
jgi:hypothetical protein